MKACVLTVFAVVATFFEANLRVCRKEEQDVEGEAEETNKISMQFCAFCRLCQVQFSLMREKEEKKQN